VVTVSLSLISAAALDQPLALAFKAAIISIIFGPALLAFGGLT
jgi:hypothetical protein